MPTAIRLLLPWPKPRLLRLLNRLKRPRYFLGSLVSRPRPSMPSVGLGRDCITLSSGLTPPTGPLNVLRLP